LYWLTANMAARQPVLIAVDDAHWAEYQGAEQAEDAFWSL